VSFIFRGRSQRTTTRQQIVARTRMAQLEEALKEAQEKQAAEAEPSANRVSIGDKAAETAEPAAAPLQEAPES